MALMVYRISWTDEDETGKSIYTAYVLAHGLEKALGILREKGYRVIAFTYRPIAQPSFLSLKTSRYRKNPKQLRLL